MKNLYWFLLFFLLSCTDGPKQTTENQRQGALNILFVIADDQSFPYTSIYGSSSVQTPVFDAIAKRGVLFNNAFCAAPQCSPSRAAILTGKNIWELEEAGTHSSYFPKKFEVFTTLLEDTGYALGYTGKPWAPGNWKDAGWERNPVGPAFNEIQSETVPYSGLRKTNYSANFKAFLDQKTASQPFFFWYGAFEPHRAYESGSGQKAGKTLQSAEVPAFLPNDSLCQSDILDYALEIEWFDKHLGEMIAYLEAANALEQTLIIITADNGMPFPYAKANLQEYGTHVPLAIAGPGIPGNRVVDDLVSLIDIGPTILDFANAQPLKAYTGRSLKTILSATEEGLVDTSRTMVLTGRERHTHARPDNLGYPARAIRTADFLYIHNFKPERWPAGDPEYPIPSAELAKGQGRFKSMKDGFHDIDACPSKTHLLEQKDSLAFYFNLAVAKRPADQLYHIKKDAACLNNLANDPNYSEQLATLKNQLFTSLKAQGDPRVLGNGDIFDSYPRFASMRQFPGFKARGKYNPKYQLPISD